MIVEFDKSFSKSIGKIKDNSVLKRTESFILILEAAERLDDVRGVKKLQGHSSYYRHRIGDYRLGFELLDKDTIRFIILAHRKEIYKLFP